MKKIIIKNSGYNIHRAKITNVKTLTDMEKMFRIQLPERMNLDHEPGQFVEVSLFGVGEAPISVCSSPDERGFFELCVRRAGRVTDKMHLLADGDEIGIRGPFGKGFPIPLLCGNDILIVAGGLGIAPLRSLINYIIYNRRTFGKVTILLGCKDPSSMLFSDELGFWQERADINFCCTVDKSDPDWKGNVGMITSLIPGVNLNPFNTYAVVCGPPVMYSFVIKELLKKKIPTANIILSLERHMKCGLGKCGHCQIDDIYCCQDGPVFRYKDIMNIQGII